MKIFSWVHKTLRHSSLKDGFHSSNVRKAESDVMKWDDDDNNNQASLKEVALADVVGGNWKDGFLTIGTLGCYGPLFKCSKQHRDYLAFGSDEDVAEQHGDDEEESKYCDSDEHDDEEMKPLIGTKFENNIEDVVRGKPNNLVNAVEVEALVSPTPTLVSDDDDDVIECCVHVGMTDEKEEKKGERITLADLFLADSEKIIINYVDDAAKAKVLLDDDGDKQSLKAKHGQTTFAKKLISRVNKDNPHPIKSIRKLMKKMIKKKIHPEVIVKNQKSEGHQKPSDATDQISDENQKIEGTSG